jgi:hypothetical protein
VSFDLLTVFLIFAASGSLAFGLLTRATGNNKTNSLPLTSMQRWQFVGLKGNQLQKRLVGSYFAAILQALHAASTSFACSNMDLPNLYLIAIPGHIRLLFCLSIEIRIAFAILNFWM